jgi:hypothetical protein
MDHPTSLIGSKVFKPLAQFSMRALFLAPLLLTSSLFGEENDRLVLGNGDLFVGKVVSLDDGLIKLKSPHSETPLEILNENLQILSFADQKDSAEVSTDLPKNSQEVILGNGDRFPGELIALDDKAVTFQTWFTGDLSVQRAQISSLLFGVTPQTSIYRGPEDLDEWDQESERNWRVSEGILTAQQRATIGRDFNLPVNFVFKSRISWNSSPNSRIHLCSEKTTIENGYAGNSYLINLNSTGVQVQRVTYNDEGKPVIRRLFSNAVSLRSRKAKSIVVELLVDRESDGISLYLDGKKAGLFLDPYGSPAGTCAIFESQSHGQGDMTVSEIEVNDWDTKTQALLLEPRVDDDALDTLSTAEGDRHGGEILSYDPAEENPSFSIKTDFAPEPFSIPLEHCAVMYFARTEREDFPKCRYRINLKVGGHLTVSKIQLGAEFLTATHPWLGTLKIDRRVMKSITKS